MRLKEQLPRCPLLLTSTSLLPSKVCGPIIQHEPNGKLGWTVFTRTDPHGQPQGQPGVKHLLGSFLAEPSLRQLLHKVHHLHSTASQSEVLQPQGAAGYCQDLISTAQQDNCYRHILCPS